VVRGRGAAWGFICFLIVIGSPGCKRISHLQLNQHGDLVIGGEYQPFNEPPILSKPQMIENGGMPRTQLERWKFEKKIWGLHLEQRLFLFYDTRYAIGRRTERGVQISDIGNYHITDNILILQRSVSPTNTGRMRIESHGKYLVELPEASKGYIEDWERISDAPDPSEVF